MSPLEKSEAVVLHRLLSRAKWRVRLRAMLAGSERLMPIQLIAMTGWIAAEWHLRTGGAMSISTRWLVLACLLLAPWAGVVARVVLRRSGQFSLSLWIDRQLGSDDLVTAALCFARHNPRTRLEEAVLRRAIERARRVDLAPIIPLGRHPRLWILISAGAVLAAIPLPVMGDSETRMVSNQPPHQAPSQGLAPHRRPRDVEELRRILGDLTETEASQRRREVGGLQPLMEQYLLGRVDSAALEIELASIERRLESRVEPRVQELSGLAHALSQHAATRILGAALELGHAKDARLALEALEKRWREPRTRLSKEELAALRRAVDAERIRRLGRQSAEEVAKARLTEEREALRREDRGPEMAAQAQRLDAIERRLEHLDRHSAAQKMVEPALSALDHALLEAADELRKAMGSDMGAAFAGFDAAKSQLERLDQLIRTDAEKRRLLEQLRRIRDWLRRKESVEEGQNLEMQRFAKRAAGESASPRSRAEPPMPPVQTQSEPSWDAASLEVVPLPIPGNQPRAQSREAAGHGPPSGNHHEERLRGDPKSPMPRPARGVVAATPVGADGTVSASVVAAAAERGFSGAEYREIFRAYAPVAEALLAGPALNRAKRAQVRRYFDLIRPREGKE